MFDQYQKFCVFDYETFSEANIKLCGSYEYSMHESTEVLVASWLVGTLKELQRALKRGTKASSYAPKRSWNKHRKDLRTGEQLLKILNDPSIIIVAHNALFEQAITRNVFIKHVRKLLNIKGPWIIPHERFLCTAVLSSVCALPRSLDGATAALKLDHVKDKVGHRLMLNWCKPKKPSKKDPTTRYLKNFDRLVEYCEHDIYAEVALLLTLPQLKPSERKLWLFDQEINFRGAKVDRELVSLILKMIAEEKAHLVKQLRLLTKGKVQTGGQTAVIKKWCRRNGVKLPNLQAKTVQDAINNKETSELVRKVLTIRTSLNKTSLKKYSAFLNHTTSDSYMRFSLNFAATVHGRWGGAGVQPHNFPRGTLKYDLHYTDDFGKPQKQERDLASYAADLIKSGTSLEFLRSMFEDPIEVFVSCLRCMIITEEDEDLYVSDFSAIEARVLFWLADHEEGLLAFIEKRKMYEELAMVIFKKTSISQVTKDERFIGKQSFLLSGYGGGWKKFQSTCEGLGNPVTTQVAKKAIDGYRKVNAPVVKLWSNLSNAAISAVQNPSKLSK